MPLPAGGDGTAGIESGNRFAVGFPQLLRETDATVEDISNRCGYGSTMSMYRAIRKATGLTPIAYREMAY